MRKETVSLGDMVTVHELEWLLMASGVLSVPFDLVPVPHVTGPLLLFLTTSNSLDFKDRVGMGTTGA